MAQQPSKRDYKKEYADFHGKPEQVKKRGLRVKARRIMEGEGLASKGDGKDVDHKTPLSKGGKTTLGNLRVKTAHANRSFKRNKDSSIK